ncbi:hypothetical protein NE237_010688 [Protea cynaroides]|uniref:Protein kinase domain-containing protein n=1 Tax=Protea cynaroides TaxID=273540 RepID=A0A9Q0L011_9MAGN|nr:hypothetical protein NE237_010688 [Protea cynaroides]
MYAIGGGSAASIINSQGNRFLAPNDRFNKEVMTKHKDAPESEWKNWNWRSKGDQMLNGAFFTGSGVEGSSSHAKASSSLGSSSVVVDLDEIEQPSTPLRARSYRQSYHGLLSFVSHLDTPGIDLSQKVVGSNNPRIFSCAELYIASKGFSEDEIPGNGGFSRVYRALLPSDGTTVAVKCLFEKGEPFEKTFAAELMVVAQLRHRNLIRLRGWCVK